MSILGLIASIAIAGVPNSAADAITLRDGSIVLGQVVDPPPKGKVVLVVRRAWAEKALPQKFKVWKAAEGANLQKGKADRLHRLEEWKRERDASPAEKDDAIGPWLAAEIERLKANADAPPLMFVSLNKADVKAVARRNAELSRKLRQAWRAGFADAETKTASDLNAALEGRGFAMTDVDPAPIDDLLPILGEPENRWKARRAATEVQHDRGLRYIQAQGMVLPEPTPGAAADAKDLLGGLLKSQLGNADADPLSAARKTVADRGRAGLIVTRLETDEDLAGVKLEVSLYARTGRDRWEVVTRRTAHVRANEVKPGEGAGIADDPQVKAVFRGIEGLGIEIPAELKQNGLMIGAATQKAIAQARTAIQPDLDALALPVEAKPNAAP